MGLCEVLSAYTCYYMLIYLHPIAKTAIYHWAKAAENRPTGYIFLLIVVFYNTKSNIHERSFS